MHGDGVSLWALCAVAGLILAWSLLSARFERFDVSGPIVFVVAGLLIGHGPFEQLHVAAETSFIHELAEITLVLVLFSDAARVDPSDLRRHAGLPLRLLAIGLPLTIAAGFALAAALLTDVPWQLAALLGAALAPTDAALSAAVVSDRAIPVRLRRTLNVESGLNDGIATPVVTGLIAASTVLLGQGEFADSASAPGWSALRELVTGAGIGIVAGYVGGRAIRASRARGWTAPGGERVATLMLAVLAFLVARELEVNYFVAAFVAGIAFRAGRHDESSSASVAGDAAEAEATDGGAVGAATSGAASGAAASDDGDDPTVDESVALPELLGQVLSLVVWYVFGAVLLVDGLRPADWRIVVYALASLTVIRMVPVALSLVGSRTTRRDTVFLGWFGPRGLASVIFGLLIVEELPPDDPMVLTVTSAITLTVVLSVILHGVSARPMTAWLTRGRSGEAGPEASGAADDESVIPRRPFGLRHHLHR